MYSDLLKQLRAAVVAGRVAVPLCSTHYIEMSRIKDPNQRAAVALTMGELSKYIAFTSRERLLAYQVRRSIAAEFDVSYDTQPAIFGHGFAHAFGQPPVVGRLKGDRATVARFIEEHGEEFIARLAEFVGGGWTFVPSGRAANRVKLFYEATDAVLQFVMLRGPTDEALPDLLKLGYSPQESYDVTERIAKREAEMATLLAEQPASKRRLDDIIAARAMYWDVGEEWIPAMTELGVAVRRLEDIGKAALHRILDGVPIIAVESALRRGNFRNGSYEWSTNDVYDIGFIGAAVSSCDVVLTEKHVQTQLTQQGVNHRFDVAILRRPKELTDWIATHAT